MAEKRKEDKDRLFSDISAAQVIATALASVTSMLLASYIGIAGSVIGVAVASIVSTVAGSAYKKFLRDSGEKIKELPLPGIHDNHGAAQASQAPAGDGEAAGGIASGAATAAAGGETARDAGQATPPNPERTPRDSSGRSQQPSPAVRNKRLIRGLIVVCILSALLAVAASGAVVYLVTTGEGLGAKPPSVVYVASSSDTAAPSTGSTAATTSSEAAEKSTASTEAGKKSAASSEAAASSSAAAASTEAADPSSGAEDPAASSTAAGSDSQPSADSPSPSAESDGTASGDEDAADAASDTQQEAA